MYCAWGLAILSFCSLANGMGPQAEKKQELAISVINGHVSLEDEQTFKKMFPSSCLLTKLSLVADIAFDEPEVRKLFTVTEGSRITSDELWHGIVLLAKKQTFSRIRVGVTSRKGSDAVAVTVTLVGAWTMGRLRIRGSLLGKERYRAFYVLEPGDPFEMKKHTMGLVKIREALELEGFFNAKLEDSFVYDQGVKSVNVSIDLDPGKQFVIDEISLSVVMPQEKCVCEDADIAEKLTKQLDHLLHRTSYTKKVVDDAAKTIRNYVVGRGFFNTTLSLEQAVNIAKKSVRLSFTVELKQQHLFEFRGNSFFTKEQLFEQIALFGSSAVLIPPTLIAQELMAEYKKEGFWDVRIDWQEDGERIFFFITEGDRVTIDAVLFRGMEHQEPSFIAKTCFSPLLHAEYFSNDVLQQAFDSLTRWYITQGFWDISISDYTYQVMKPGHYELQITIDEGTQRLLTAISIGQGFDVASPSWLAEYQNMKQPIPFDHALISQQRQKLTMALKKAGKIYVTPRPDLIEQEKGILVVWKFEGYPETVQFGKTIVQGEHKIPSFVMTRELAYEEGETWDPEKIESSVAQLKNLGVFDVVSLVPENPDLPELCKTMMLKCVEDTPYEVRVRLGIQGVNRNLVKFNFNGLTYKAGGSFLAKNIARRADILRFDVDFSRFMHTAVASYRLPWIGNIPLSAEWKLYSNRYAQPVMIGSPDILYNVSQDGGLMALQRSVKSWTCGINFGCEWIGITPSGLLPPDDPEGGLATAIHLNRRLINHRYPYFFIEPTVVRSSVDNKLQPTQGAVTVFSLKAMGSPSVSGTAMIKFLFEQSGYISLTDTVVLALRGRCGTIVDPSLYMIEPIERFYLGGACSLRSYDFDKVPPLNVFVDNSGKQRLVPTGGKSMINGNVEIRFPIISRLGGIIFTDLGSLSESGINEVRAHHLVGGVGFGLRLNTGIGPLRFDIGWKLRRDRAIEGIQRDRSYSWFLAFGNAF